MVKSLCFIFPDFYQKMTDRGNFGSYDGSGYNSHSTGSKFHKNVKNKHAKTVIIMAKFMTFNHYFKNN